MIQADATESEVFDFIRERCERTKAVKRAVLFGSRARGDAHERSDFDVAIEAPELSSEDWAQFALGLRENVPTLCGLDLVRWDGTTSSELQKKIRNEGVDLYVRK